MNVAQIILQQIGGNQFVVMTGARNFVAREKSLTFGVPGTTTKNRANRVVVELTPDDLYTVTFQRLHACKLTTVGEVSGIYADQLRGTFERATGLRTSLTAVYG